MPTDAKLAPPVAAVASALLHAALLVAGLSASAHPNPAGLEARDRWGAHSVEVGTVSEPSGTRAEPPAATPPVAPPPVAVAPPAAAAPQTPSRAVQAPGPESPPGDDGAQRARARASPRADQVVAARRSAGGAGQGAPALPSAESPPSGSFGALGLPPGVRHLATAFTRALPAGSYRDSAWSELPLGTLGEAEVALRVSESGVLEDVKVSPERGLHPALARMIERAELLLKSGTFSLDPQKVRGGVEHLWLEVTLSQRGASADELAAPQQLFEQGYKPPTSGQAGFARFTLNSGRHVQATVRLVEK